MEESAHKVVKKPPENSSEFQNTYKSHRRTNLLEFFCPFAGRSTLYMPIRENTSLVLQREIYIYSVHYFFSLYDNDYYVHENRHHFSTSDWLREYIEVYFRENKLKVSSSLLTFPDESNFLHDFNILQLDFLYVNDSFVYQQ